MPAYLVLDVAVQDSKAYEKFILEFPTVEQGPAWWASREYGPAKALRQACAHTDMVLVEGVPSATT